MDAIRSVKTKTDVGVTAATTSSLESAPSEAAPTMFISIYDVDAGFVVLSRALCD
jgi:hypothetical protein